jgi:hypothetical protein
MICKISKIQSINEFQAKIDYNEYKLEKGVAQVLFDDTFSTNKNDRIKTFLDCKSLNNNVRKNIAIEVTFNLPPGESLSDEKFESLIRDYMLGMGIEENSTPVIGYKHMDSRHNHVHLYLSQITWEGVKIQNAHSFYKSQEVSRKLEIKYDLRRTEYEYKNTEISLNSNNQSKYYLQNAIRKGLKASNTKDYLNSVLSEQQIAYLNKHKRIENDQISIFLGKTHAKDILKFLDDQNLINKGHKAELFKKVEFVFNEFGNDAKSFVEKLKEDGLYVRKVYKKGKPHFVYGLKEVSFYVDDNKLDKRFTYNAIIGDEKIRKEFLNTSHDIETQKEYLKTAVPKALYNKKTLDDFSIALQDEDIELITYQNKGGIYGIAFKSTNFENAAIIKGSDIDISWNDIKEILIENNGGILVESEDIYIVESVEIEDSYVPQIPFSKNIHNKNEGEDYESIRKKYRIKKTGLSR